MKPARTLVLALLALAAALTVSPATAAAARTSVPTVSRVAPLNLAIGDTLTITGRNFRAGRNRNTVVFKRDGQRAVFVTAQEATSTRLRLVVPAKLSQYLSRRSGGTARPTRFRLRILAARFGRAFTATKLSPVIGEGNAIETTPGTTSGTSGVAAVSIVNTAGQQTVAPVDTDPDCDADGVRNSVDDDDDNDFLSDALEISLKLSTCTTDTDGDGMQDGWEYQSAVDLNTPGCNNPAYPTPCSPATPYPWKVPYPNPLDGTDTSTDFDGDWLRAFREHDAWERHAGHDLSISGMWYSAGLKSSQDPVADSCVGMEIPTPRAPFTTAYSTIMDANDNGCLSDGERDEDGDMLSNNTELTGKLSDLSWWTTNHKTESPFTYQTYRGTKWLDADTDGDNVYDGMDDQDFDDYWNAEEQVRGTPSFDADGNATGVSTGLWGEPFNPCVPNLFSRTCPDFVLPGSEPWIPWPKADGTLTYPRWPMRNGAAPTHPIGLPS